MPSCSPLARPERETIGFTSWDIESSSLAQRFTIYTNRGAQPKPNVDMVFKNADGGYDSDNDDDHGEDDDDDDDDNDGGCG